MYGPFTCDVRAHLDVAECVCVCVCVGGGGGGLNIMQPCICTVLEM